MWCGEIEGNKLKDTNKGCYLKMVEMWVPLWTLETEPTKTEWLKRQKKGEWLMHSDSRASGRSGPIGQRKRKTTWLKEGILLHWAGKIEIMVGVDKDKFPEKKVEEKLKWNREFLCHGLYRKHKRKFVRGLCKVTLQRMKTVIKLIR